MRARPRRGRAGRRGADDDARHGTEPCRRGASGALPRGGGGDAPLATAWRVGRPAHARDVFGGASGEGCRGGRGPGRPPDPLAAHPPRAASARGRSRRLRRARPHLAVRRAPLLRVLHVRPPPSAGLLHVRRGDGRRTADLRRCERRDACARLLGRRPHRRNPETGSRGEAGAAPAEREGRAGGCAGPAACGGAGGRRCPLRQRFLRAGCEAAAVRRRLLRLGVRRRIVPRAVRCVEAAREGTLRDGPADPFRPTRAPRRQGPDVATGTRKPAPTRRCG